MARNCSRFLFCSGSFRPVLHEKGPVKDQFTSSAASCQGWGRGFESHRPLQYNQQHNRLFKWNGISLFRGISGEFVRAVFAMSGIFAKFQPRYAEQNVIDSLVKFKQALEADLSTAYFISH